MKVGDIVKLTGEGLGYIYEHIKKISNDSVGLIVKIYPYEDGDSQSNGQDVYDVLISGTIIQCLFNSEIMSTK